MEIHNLGPLRLPERPRATVPMPAAGPVAVDPSESVALSAPQAIRSAGDVKGVGAPRPSAPKVSAQPAPLQAFSSPGTILMEFDAPLEIAPVSGRTESQAMREREKTYTDRFPYKEPTPQTRLARQALLKRYGDSRVLPFRVHEVNAKYAASLGADLDVAPATLRDLPFDPGSASAFKKEMHQLTDVFFNNPNSTQSPAKADLVKKQTDRFVDLMLKSQSEEGSELSCDEAYKLVAGNIAALAVQDRAATENALGDHGVRHLVGHNIRVCETMADQIEKNGGAVSAKDRLILHQAMILHDIGYATQNVRGAINHDGIQGQDAGHPLLSARYIRERSESAEDPLHKVFSKEDLGLVHRCVLYHDVNEFGKSGINLHVGAAPTSEQRVDNLESMMRIADNTHAFEDKLPEFLYSNPKTLVSMRLIKAASEIGDKGSMDTLKERLKDQIASREDLSLEDRRAMCIAASKFEPLDGIYSMRRIVGNEPEYALDSRGKVTLTVQESAVHKDIAQIAGDERYKILRMWVKDLSDLQLGQISPQQRVIDSEKVTFKVNLGAQRAKELTPFQSEIQKVFTGNEPFSRWATRDNCLGKTQEALEKLIESAPGLSGESLSQAASTFCEPGSAPIDSLRARLAQVRDQRQQILHGYMEQA